MGYACAEMQPAPSSAELPASVPASEGQPLAKTEAELARLRLLFDQHFAFTWRYLRRIGLSASDADDAGQKVFLVLARRLGDVERGRERAFLCATALRVVSEHRRALARRPEVTGAPLERDDLATPPSSRSGPEALLDRRRARVLLDEVLDAMPIELRSVFVLFELEEASTAEIAALLELPEGTVASRLRRAREWFRAALARLRASGQIPGGSV
jgi:RNA polymerase sigma-70 factor (ECF subfamily)